MEKIKEGFVDYRAQEAKLEITGRMADRLHVQESYREAVLKRVFQQTMLNDFLAVLEIKLKNKEEGPFEFCGSHYSSLKNATADYHLAQNSFRQLCTQENYLRDALVKDGLTESQIEDLIENGKLVKFIPSKQKKKEADAVKKETDYVG
jgi:hypothetical protein